MDAEGALWREKGQMQADLESVVRREKNALKQMWEEDV